MVENPKPMKNCRKAKNGQHYRKIKDESQGWLVFEMQIYAILELENLCVSLNFGGQQCNNNSLTFWL